MKTTTIRPAHFFIEGGRKSVDIGFNSLLLGLAVHKISKLTGQTEKEIFDEIATSASAMYAKQSSLINSIGHKFLTNENRGFNGIIILKIEIDHSEDFPL